MIKILITLLFLTISAFASISVAVSIAPQKYFLQQIMGEDADITVLVPSGASPATYAPKPSQLKALNKAALYFSIGVPFEKNWLPRFQSINPKMKIIDSTNNIKKLTMKHDIEEDKHHKEHEHHHSGLDPHVWLSPSLVILQAKEMRDALIMIDAKNSHKYEKNYTSFKSRLKTLDKTIRGILSPVKQKSFIVFHPSFGYFAKDFGLNQVAIEKEGKEPSLRYIKRVIDYAKKQNIKTVFVATQFSQKAAAQIAKQIAVDVTTIDPLSQDWENNLLQIAKSFEKAN